jgi:hypothetical protein
MSVVEVVDEAGYRALLASERLAVLHFWADFAAECRTVTAVLTELGTGVSTGHFRIKLDVICCLLNILKYSRVSQSKVTHLHFTSANFCENQRFEFHCCFSFLYLFS